jgi:hypothetical protein
LKTSAPSSSQRKLSANRLRIGGLNPGAGK